MATQSRGPGSSRPVPGPRRPPNSLEAFLSRHHLEVRDVVPAAAPDARRLLLGHTGTGRLSHAVAVAPTDGTVVSVDREQDVLTRLRTVLGTELAVTLPRVVERVEVGTASVGLVVTAVPGLRPPSSQETRSTHDLLEAVDDWLARLWRETGTEDVAPVDLGADGAEWLGKQYLDSGPFSSCLATIHQAEARLRGLEAHRATVHGCLCPRHVFTCGSQVTGVDDWGLASTRSDPLRDVTGFAVRLAGPRLVEVLGGRTSFARSLRGFVAAGLERAALPAGLWRESLVLARLDCVPAAAARGETDPTGLVLTLARALPQGRRGRETRKP